jgi:hypothetical protein
MMPGAAAADFWTGPHDRMAMTGVMIPHGVLPAEPAGDAAPGHRGLPGVRGSRAIADVPDRPLLFLTKSTGLRSFHRGG